MNDFYTHASDPWEASVRDWQPKRKRKIIYVPPLSPFLLLATFGVLLMLTIVA
jgi:hypothetical protein